LYREPIFYTITPVGSVKKSLKGTEKMAQETLGKLLKEAREKRRWSQAKLAGQLGIVSQTVLRWEQDKSVPREDCRQPLIELLGLDEEVFSHAKKPKIHEKVDISETTVREENVEQQEATDFVEVIVPLVKVYYGWSTTSDSAGEKYVTVGDRPLPYVHFDRSGYIVADASGHLNWGYTGGGSGNLALSLLTDYFGETPLPGEARRDIPQAWKYRNNFKMDFVAWFEKKQWEIWSGAITAWLKEQKEGGDPAPEHTLADIEHGWLGWSEKWDKYRGT